MRVIHLGMSFTNTSLASDEGRLLAFVLAVIAVLALARWAARISESHVTHEPSPYSSDCLEVQTPASLVTDSNDVVRSFPHDPALGPIQMLRFYFVKSDALRGPPVPEVFADELIVRLYHSESGYTWEQSYYVATPRGLEDVLKTKAWSYLYTPSVIVVARYDLETIRQAVVARIVEDHEHVPVEEKNQAREELM